MTGFSSSKLIKLINLLSLKEFDDLETWLDLRQNRTPKKIKVIYSYLKKQYQNNKLEAVTKQVLYKKVYPRNSYNANYLNNLIRGFVKLLESYLAFLESQKKQNSRYFYFQSLLHRGESFFFFKEITEYIDGQPQETSSLYLLQLYQLLYSHPAYDKKYDKDSGHIMIQNGFLEDFFLEEKYTLLNEMDAIGQDQERSIKQREISNLETFRVNSNSKIVSLFEERFLRGASLTFPMFDDFYKKYLEHIDSLSAKYKRIFLLLCINDATRLSVMGKGELVDHKLFNLYELGIGEKLIFTKPTVTPIMFNNYVTIALKLNKIDLLKEFLWKRELFLPTAWSQDAITWAESKLAYQLGHFTKVIALNEKYIIQQWLYKLQMKVILLQTYYDLVEAKEYRYDTLKNHLGSFKKFINRNKKKYRFRPEPYLFLISFTKKLHKVNAKKESQMIKELKKIEEAIQKEKALFGRNWLLKKIDEKLQIIQ